MTDKITTDTTQRVSFDTGVPATTLPTGEKPIIDGPSVTQGTTVGKTGNTEGAGAPQIEAPPAQKTDSPFTLTDEQATTFMNLLLKLLQLAGEMMETQAENMKNRQAANTNVYNSSIDAAKSTRTKNVTNAAVGIAAGGLTLVAASVALKQLGSSASKIKEFTKISKGQAGAGETGVTAVSDASKLQLKGLGREIDQLNAKGQTISAAATSLGNTAVAGGQMGAAIEEYKAAALDALANLQRTGAQSLDQAVTSSQSVIDKLSTEMVASLKNLAMSAVR